MLKQETQDFASLSLGYPCIWSIPMSLLLCLLPSPFCPWISPLSPFSPFPQLSPLSNPPFKSFPGIFICLLPSIPTLQSWSFMRPFTNIAWLPIALESILNSPVARISFFPEPLASFFQSLYSSHSFSGRAFASVSSLLPKPVLQWKPQQTQQRSQTHCPSHFPELRPAVWGSAPCTGVSAARAVLIVVGSLGHGTVSVTENEHRKGLLTCMKEWIIVMDHI